MANRITRQFKKVKPYVTGEVQCFECGHRWDIERGGADVRKAERVALAEECPGPNHPSGTVTMTAGMKRTIRRLLEGERVNLQRTTVARLAGIGLAVRHRPGSRSGPCYPLHPERFAERCEEIDILRPKLETEAVRRCADCGDRRRCTWDICPHESDVGGETDPAKALWLCGDCVSTRAADI